MDHTEYESARPVPPARMQMSEWYRKGFADGYRARRPVVVLWSAGEQYKKGYAEGLATAQRVFAEAVRD